MLANPAAAEASSVEAKPDRVDQPTVDQPGVDQPHINQLMAGGFSRARAEEILKREEQLRLAVFYDEYTTTGAVRPFNSSARFASAERLRRQLGDSDYERYLKATGQPTRVTVGTVASASAAANAGLLPGDEITTYAGQRVFNLRDLHALALALRGSSGEIVAMSVVRDGQPMQLYVTRGSLGLR